MNMNYLLKREAIEHIKKHYEAGTRIEAVHICDAYAPEPGTKGTVVCVDDIGTIHVKWDNGRTLGCIPGIDQFHIIAGE